MNYLSIYMAKIAGSLEIIIHPMNSRKKYANQNAQHDAQIANSECKCQTLNNDYCCAFAHMIFRCSLKSVSVPMCDFTLEIQPLSALVSPTNC